MKIITKKKQKEINELNIKKLMFAMEIIYCQHCNNIDKSKKFRIEAESIYYSDDVIL